LDENLNLIKEIRILDVSISDIVRAPDRLFVLATRNTEIGEVESVLIRYDIAQGRENKRWSNPKYYIWSVSAIGKTVVAMSEEGTLLELGPKDFEEIMRYPGGSHYIPIDGSEPIICTAPDLTKLNWKPADLL